MGEKTSKERNGIKATTVVRLNQPITITFVHDVGMYQRSKEDSYTGGPCLT